MDIWILCVLEMMVFLIRKCLEGIMIFVWFFICWDGKNLDFFDYMVYMFYFEYGIFESGGFCLVSYFVRML